MRAFVVLLGLFLGVVSASAQTHEYPNLKITPGETISAVPSVKAAACLTKLTRASVVVGAPITQKMLCTTGFTTCIRQWPVPISIRVGVYKSYGISIGKDYCTGGCELDHLVPLEIGGADTVKNMWPEPYGNVVWTAKVKDQLENQLHAMICSGKITMQKAQAAIIKDWIAAYKLYVSPTPK